MKGSHCTLKTQGKGQKRGSEMALATLVALHLFVVVLGSAFDVITAVAPGLVATFSVSGSAPAVVSVYPPTPEMEEEEPAVVVVFVVVVVVVAVLVVVVVVGWRGFLSPMVDL